MKKINILYIEDDLQFRDNMRQLLEHTTFGEVEIGEVDTEENFDDAIGKIATGKYQLVILDIFKGDINAGEQLGLEVLKDIQEHLFIPVVFYSGNTSYVDNLKSQVVGVASKGGDGIAGLKNEIQRIAKNNLPFIRENLQQQINEELKDFFWNIVQEKRDIFSPDKNDYSLPYLMLRRFSQSLTAEKIAKIVGDESLAKDKVHPMQFYVYPTDSSKEFECGEILQKDKNVYVVLTPSCDFVKNKGRARKANRVLLTKTSLLSEEKVFSEYKTAFIKLREVTKNGDAEEIKRQKDSLCKKGEALRMLIERRRGDRYFFLPQTPFLENRIIDFQQIETCSYDELLSFSRLAKLDSPYAESMMAFFNRYYNRIGTPDLDAECIIKSLV